jgi:hypothetical protein
MLVNVAYIGHWVHKQVIAQWHNHEAIIPEELFMFAFNRISRVDFHGQANPHYVAYRPWVRHAKEDRTEEPPIYAYLTYTDDLEDEPHKMLASIWSPGNKKYKYQLYQYPDRSNIWNINAEIVDDAVDAMLLERLKETNIDEDIWQTALLNMQSDSHSDVRRVEQAIRQAQQTKDNLIESLATINNDEMIQRVEARYEATEQELNALEAELVRLQSGEKRQLTLDSALPVLQTVIENWQDVPRNERRSLFESFATHIHISKVTRHTKHITVHWRDSSTSMHSTTHRSKGYFWEDEDLDRLKAMFDNDVDQVEILRAFPDYVWRALTQRMRYHFGKGWWKGYQGEKKYPRNTSWADTEEAQAEQGSQLVTSSASTG